MAITFVNYFKMQLRNDTLLMEDISLIKEAIAIKKNYTFTFTPLMITWIIAMIAITVIIYVALDRKNKFYKDEKLILKIFKKIVVLVVFVVVAYVSLERIYINPDIYGKLENKINTFNKWSETNQYITRGTMYSFLNSYSGIKKHIPEGYNKKEAEQKLFSYEYSDIPDDKKVNVIGIMLEAYNDFSKFDEIEFERNPYESWHKIEEQSVSGELVTNIFAGGTINTERKFLTGYTELGTFRKKTNSYVQYFNEQGYYTTGEHPSFAWFYNRQNIDRNLGFQDYYFRENRYADLADDKTVSDEVFISDLINLYNTRDKSVPYFSFSVSYQNHGPYSDEKLFDTTYVNRKDYYTDEEYNILNNYFWGIEDTSNQILRLTEELKEDDSPVVVIVFGDHNPWLGNDNSVYNMLGINLNLDTDDGIYNYYSTPYIIWANNKAKEVLQNDFIGEGGNFGPYFLMNKFFELAGYEGNEFMKASNDLRNKNITVINDNFYCLDNEIIRTSSEDEKEINEFLKLEYYWKNNYRER